MWTRAHGRTQGGSRRPGNQDHFVLLDDRLPRVARAGRGQVFAVFDGISSAPRAEDAARHAGAGLERFFVRGGPSLSQLLHRINQEIRAWGLAPHNQRPAGAAAGTVAWLDPGRQLWIYHCGDTAAFLWNGAELKRLTVEHRHGRRLTSYFGWGRDGFQLQVGGAQMKRGDRLLLASDGVYRALGEKALIRALRGQPRGEGLVSKLIDDATQAGDDDATAVLVDLVDWNAPTR